MEIIIFEVLSQSSKIGSFNLLELAEQERERAMSFMEVEERNIHLSGGQQMEELKEFRLWQMNAIHGYGKI